MPFNFFNPSGPGAPPASQGSGPASPQPQAPPGPQAPQPQRPQAPPQPGQAGSFNYANFLGGNPADRYQGEVDRISTELRNAQMQGAPPAVIADLQAQLDGANMEMQQAGASYAYGRQKNKPHYGGGVGQRRTGGSGGGRGGQLSPAQQKSLQDYDAFTQMMMFMFGMGGGRGYGGGTPPRGDGW